MLKKDRETEKHFQTIEIISDVIIIISICYTNARCNQNNILHVFSSFTFSTLARVVVTFIVEMKNFLFRLYPFFASWIYLKAWWASRPP